MWFERLTGFREESPQQVRENISVEGEYLKSNVNGKSYQYGRLETPNLGDLRHRVDSAGSRLGEISVGEVVADTRKLHSNEANACSLFQVASQFNLLEMVSPNVTPEDGINKYEQDFTQGPACAIAAGAGTIYRNYFAVVNGQTGQTTDNQIDCLVELGLALGNTENRYWEMRNGYALATRDGLIKISERLESSTESELDELRQLLRVGIQWKSEVTISESKHVVSQVYCSALPVAYSQHPPELWAPFAQLILDASYEATICAGILNYLNYGNNKVFLTLIGGGAFGNETNWIISAIRRALSHYKNVNLDIKIVSYGSSKECVQRLINQFSK